MNTNTDTNELKTKLEVAKAALAAKRGEQPKEKVTSTFDTTDIAARVTHTINQLPAKAENWWVRYQLKLTELRLADTK